jgi:GNAT superfamily N-acetyltransferase
MVQRLAVEMMPSDFILWRCLHGGPLTRDNLDHPDPNPQVDWPSARARNVPILRALTASYGACAILSRDGDRVVGILRFYPRAVLGIAGSLGFCLQRPFPGGPPRDFAAAVLPLRGALEDRTLVVHCMAAGQPGAGEDPHRRRGLGTRMVRKLIDWARAEGWDAIEATAYADLDVLYAITGAAGRTFWEKIGFRVARTGIEPELRKEGDLLDAMRREATERGMAPDRLADKYAMLYELS